MDEKKNSIKKGTWEEGIRSQKVRSEFPTNELCRLTFAYRVPATTATVFLSRPRSLARSALACRQPKPKAKSTVAPKQITRDGRQKEDNSNNNKNNNKKYVGR